MKRKKRKTASLRDAAFKKRNSVSPFYKSIIAKLPSVSKIQRGTTTLLGVVVFGFIGIFILGFVLVGSYNFLLGTKLPFHFDLNFKISN